MNIDVYIRTGMNIQVTPTASPAYVIEPSGTTNVASIVEDNLNVEVNPQTTFTNVISTIPVWTETGVATQTWVDDFYYPRDNPSGYATGIDGSLFVRHTESGALTGAFYPLHENPSGYITGAYYNEHNLLLGLQGGQSGEYYHLNLSQYTNLPTGGGYYPNDNPSGFEPANFGLDFNILRSGTYITGLRYSDGSQTVLLYEGTRITGIRAATYSKLILYSGDTITGVKFV